MSAEAPTTLRMISSPRTRSFPTCISCSISFVATDEHRLRPPFKAHCHFCLLEVRMSQSLAQTVRRSMLPSEFSYLMLPLYLQPCIVCDNGTGFVKVG
jgi:hypothetical protein